ncbi:hypothetical protein LXM60_00700 [Pandoraea sputorum]|uniref:DUF6616 family protein n=1 Tax=Pandoraea sputorum TaxID=93222 RepID=UPI001E31C2CC|nr:DUF6616 family protein [Pandoraea sputorum]MCE4058727.1 hypothetical protein [Pandoraea sputorum]
MNESEFCAGWNGARKVTVIEHSKNSDTHIFVEAFNYKPHWHAISAAERRTVIDTVKDTLKELPKYGVDVLAWGSNAIASELRAPYDFFCVYAIVGQERFRLFEESILGSDWCKYFEEVVIGGAAQNPDELLCEFDRASTERT